MIKAACVGKRATMWMMGRCFPLTFITTPSLKSTVCNCAIELFGTLNTACTRQKDFLAAMKPFCGLPKRTTIHSTSTLYVSLLNILGNATLKDPIEGNPQGTRWARILQTYGTFSIKSGRLVFGISQM